MSSFENFDDFLEHHGIKGMRWGFRKSSSGPSARKIAKADKKWESKLNAPASGARAYFKVYNAAADTMNKTEISRINNKPEYKNADLSKPSAVRTKYYKEYADTFTRELNKQSDALLGSNASGTKRVEFLQDKKLEGMPQAQIVDVKKKIKHAELDAIPVKVEYDATGHILSFTVATPLEHGEAMVDGLFHHGIKGMRWGFRKGSGGVSTGRRKPPTSADFKKADAARRKVGVKRTGPAAKKTAVLSNEELQSLVKRMNLEKQYAELSSKDQTKAAGAMITGKILGGLAKGTGQVAGNVVKAQATQLGNQLAKEQIEKLLKNARK